MISFTTRETKSHDGRRKGRIKGRKKLSFGKVGPKVKLKLASKSKIDIEEEKKKEGRGRGRRGGKRK